MSIILAFIAGAVWASLILIAFIAFELRRCALEDPSVTAEMDANGSWPLKEGK